MATGHYKLTETVKVTKEIGNTYIYSIKCAQFVRPPGRKETEKDGSVVTTAA